MNNSFFRLPETISQQARNAFRVLAAFLGVSLVITSFITWQAIQTGAWQLWAETVSVFILIACEVGALALVRRGRHELGIWLTFTFWLAVLPLTSAMISGLGFVLLASALVVITLVAGQTLPSRQATALTILGAVVGVISLLLDLFLTIQRIVVPGFNNVIIVLVAVLALVFGYVVVRQFRNYSLRTKLITAFVAVTIVAIGIVGWVTTRLTASQINVQVGDNLSAIADGTARQIAATLDDSINTMEALALNKFVQDSVETANQTAVSNQAALLNIDQRWVNASDSSALVQGVINSDLAGEFKELQGQFPNFSEIFITDKYGAVVAATGRTSDFYQADEDWWQAAWNGGKGAKYVSQPAFDQSAKTTSVIIAVPVVSHEGTELIGVLRLTLDVTQFVAVTDAVTIGQTGHADLIFKDNQVNGSEGLLTLAPEEVAGLSELSTTGAAADINYASNYVLAALEPVTAPFSTDNALIEKLGWNVIVYQTVSEAQQTVNTTTRSIVLAAILVTIAIVLVALGMAQYLAAPLLRLTAVAEQVAAGDINVQAQEESSDETGVLAGAFNSMTSRLRGFITTLEAQVAERTRNLELAAEVGRAVSQVRELGPMLTDAAELIREQFDLYYVQVYLTDPSQANLILRSGTGSVGKQLLDRGHRLPLDTSSINGRAAVEEHSVVIEDTAASATFRPNPLLPDTRSEMAVPLIVGEKVVGVLDMQSTHPGALKEGDLSAFEALAGQLAVAVQNATLLAETEQARAEVEKQAARLVHTNWQEYMDAVHKPEQVGYIFDQNKTVPLGEVENLQLPVGGNSLTVPITITGETVGNLIVELDREAQNSQTTELINAIASQVAQHVESLRLLESAERYRLEAEEASRRLTLEGWEEYIKSRGNEGSGYMYDLKEVRPVDGNKDYQTAEPVVNLPIKVRNEAVGNLAVMGVNASDDEAVELANAVLERLSEHIENLRQVDQTRRSQLELNERASELAGLQGAVSEAAIIAVTDVQGKILEVNDNFVRISKYSREELLGQDHRILNSGYHTKEFIRDLWVTIANGRVWRNEVCNKAKDGSIYWVDTTISPIFNERGKPVKYMAVRFDITARKQAEEAITQRAAELATVARVSSTAATILDTDKLLQEVSNLTKELFNLYHSHIYLLNETGDTLVLAAGAGEAGKQMVAEKRSIPLDSKQSLVARAARNRQGVITNDVRAEDGFLPNPLLPDTRSELAVPLLVGDTVLGVFDVQSDRVNRFNPEDVNIQSTLASQIAIALQNARSFTRTQRQAERESMLNAIGQKIQSATTVEAVLQIAARELGRALDASKAVAQLRMHSSANGNGKNGNGHHNS